MGLSPLLAGGASQPSGNRQCRDRVVIGHVAGGTKRIRVGAGGIMLPNHAPARDRGTVWNSGRTLSRAGSISDLGRAPGKRSTDGARVASPSRAAAATRFRRTCSSCNPTSAPAIPGKRLQAVPGAGANVPLYLLGSSDFSARLAAELGLPFAFASHFAPQYLEVALELYRRNFKPSAELAQPHAMIGVGIFAAETDGEAERLLTSAQLQFLRMIRGQPGKLPPPVDSMEGRWSAMEEAAVHERTRCAAVGSPETVRRRVQNCSMKLPRMKLSPPPRSTIMPRVCAPSKSRVKCSPDSLGTIHLSRRAAELGAPGNARASRVHRRADSSCGPLVVSPLSS